jgi:hypothetical protein
MERKQVIAIGIALQTQVLKTCPVHQQLYFDDDVNPAGAFALAIELVRQRKPFVEVFRDDEHALTDLISDTLGAAPLCCPECQSPLGSGQLGDRGSFAQSALQRRQVVGLGQQ